MRIQHWQDVASLLLGVWLVLSPFVLGLRRGDCLDNHRAWVVRHSVCRRGICHSILYGGMGESFSSVWALVVAPWTVVYESASATVSSMVSGHTGDLVLQSGNS